MSLHIEDVVAELPAWVRSLASAADQEKGVDASDLKNFPESMQGDISRIQALAKALFEFSSDPAAATQKIDESRAALTRCISFLETKRDPLLQLKDEQETRVKALSTLDCIIGRLSAALTAKKQEAEVSAEKKPLSEAEMARMREIAQKKAALVCEIEEDRDGLKEWLPALYDVTLLLARDQLQQKDGTCVSGALSLKKAIIYWEGMKLAKRMGLRGNTQAFRLADPTPFTWAEKRAPFLSARFEPQAKAQITCTKAFFDFSPPGVYVDFANMRIGGGWLERGALQEESLIMECIDFANVLAAHRGEGKWSSRTVLFSRTPLDGSSEALEAADKLLSAQPTPLFLTGMYRIRELGGGARGSNFDKGGEEQIMAAILPREPQEICILAMAAARLPEAKSEYQFAPDTLKDFLGTVMAGFTLVKEQGIAPFVIHSGRLGCGYFNNNVRAAYALQRLAATHLGATLYLHDYNPEIEKICEADWNFVSSDLEGRTFEECIEILSRYFMSHC